LKAPITNKIDTVNHLFSYTFPDSTFIDDDGNNTLTFSATLSDGNPLPGWLSFNSATHSFSGIPTEAGTYNIKITAIDAAKASAICTFKISAIAPTGIEGKMNQHPNEFRLYQNYPDPFNPTTVIRYQLPALSNVKLTIYNVLGQKIKTLVDSFQSEGEYSVVWNATDDSNNPVSSGIYFYSLKANFWTIQKKMILLR
jgi:flagellar hook assembly protein FlgD